MEGVAVETRGQIRSAAFADARLEILAGIGLERNSENPPRITASTRAKQEVGTLRQHLGLAGTRACGQHHIARDLRSGGQRVWLKRQSIRGRPSLDRDHFGRLSSAVSTWSNSAVMTAGMSAASSASSSAPIARMCQVGLLPSLKRR